MTGISDSFGRGITGWGPVSAESGIRAGVPHEAATKAVATLKGRRRRFFLIVRRSRKNHANE